MLRYIYSRLNNLCLNRLIRCTLKAQQISCLMACSTFVFSDVSSPLEVDDRSALAKVISDIKWHGFLSQNYILTDENNYLGSSSDGSFKSNEAGLNASLSSSDQRLLFSAQALYKQIGNADPKGTRIDYAIADWRTWDTFSSGAGFRVGRIKNPYGFFNETRDVAVMNQSILLAESVYIDYLSQLLHSSDGLGFYAHHDTDIGTFSFNAQYGKPILNDHITSTLVGNPNTKGDINDEMGGFSRIAYDDAAGLWRAALSYVHFQGDFTPAASDPVYLASGQVTIEQLLLSLELNWEKWQFTTEIQRRDTRVDDIISFDPNHLEKSLGYYFQVGYNLDNAIKFYLRQDEIYRFKDDRDGSDYIFGNKHVTFAKDTTFGVRYSPSFDWSFAMEFHAIDGTYWLPDIENPDLSKQQRYWNMFLAQVAYRF